MGLITEDYSERIESSLLHKGEISRVEKLGANTPSINSNIPCGRASSSYRRTPLDDIFLHM
jgi:hypothetical protein